MYESPGLKLSWRLSGNILHSINASGDTAGSEYSAKVLAEELAYNKMLKQFRMFIIDRPLDLSYKVRWSGGRGAQCHCLWWVCRLLCSTKER